MMERLAGEKKNNIIKGTFDHNINICLHPMVERLAGVKKIISLKTQFPPSTVQKGQKHRPNTVLRGGY